MPAKMTPKTFKLTKYHIMMLSTPPYNEAPGELVRLLLDAFFDNKIPSVRLKYMLKASLLKEAKNGNKRTA